MSERATVGIRELRQDLSRYLERVKKGERLTVTDRNKPVAVLGPLPEQDDFWERMVAEGKMIPATRRWEDRPAPIETEDPLAGTKALEEVSREWWEDDPDG
jgi:prevent-host-death family protein